MEREHVKRLWLMPVLVLVLSANVCVYSDAENAAEGAANSTTAATTTPTTMATITATTSMSATTSTAAPEERSSSNTSNKVDAAGQPGTVTIHFGDCFDDDGPAACIAGVDIIGMAWEAVAGVPDQLKVTITFAGPVGGTEDFLLNMGIRGNESYGLGTNYFVENGEASWKFTG